MLDLFVILSRGGIVLWYFQAQNQAIEYMTQSVNSLIKSVILQERGNQTEFLHNRLMMKWVLDNEFDLVFVLGYQQSISISYADKLLSDVQLEFRERYKDALKHKKFETVFNFDDKFQKIYQKAITFTEKSEKPKAMRTFEESKVMENRVTMDKKAAAKPATTTKPPVENKKQAEVMAPPPTYETAMSAEQIEAKVMAKFQKKSSSPKTDNVSSPKGGKKGKQARTWDPVFGSSKPNTTDASLDYSAPAPKNTTNGKENGHLTDQVDDDLEKLRGTMSGQLPNIDLGGSDDDEDDDGGDAEESAKPKKQGGLFSMFTTLVSGKTLTPENIEADLEKLKTHLVSKNVAFEVADSLCQSVASKLEGRTVGTFETVYRTVRGALEEACMQILSPARRVDVLRDALDAKTQKRPYVIVFCGVNGVGKSTNLAKIAFWLLENKLRVMIAACDTFRAGAVEQLRTHVRRLASVHKGENDTAAVQLFEQGYGKDAAHIAMCAVSAARQSKFDVVLVDTAGRMQDNRPLMLSLSKLITVNQPDLVLFVGEALVGNDAVDQIVKFQQALADNAGIQADVSVTGTGAVTTPQNARLIDGIVLTKFDTIDDHVGAAISMTYITGQPIVFVGTGQSYHNLVKLNAAAVVKALMR